jgi:hypothetical protein
MPGGIDGQAVRVDPFRSEAAQIIRQIFRYIAAIELNDRDLLLTKPGKTVLACLKDMCNRPLSPAGPIVPYGS